MRTHTTAVGRDTDPFAPLHLCSKTNPHSSILDWDKLIFIYYKAASAEASFASYKPVWPFKCYDGQIFQYFFLALLTLNKLWNLAMRKWAFEQWSSPKTSRVPRSSKLYQVHKKSSVSVKYQKCLTSSKGQKDLAFQFYTERRRTKEKI